MKIKAIIFDLDGTLLDSVADIAAANNAVLDAYNLPTHAVEKYIDFIGNGARRLVQLALPAEWQNNEKKVNEFLELYKTAYKQNIVKKSALFDGIPELLSFLNKKGVPFAILTNKPHDQTEEIINKLFGSWKIDLYLGQKDGFPKKPDPYGAMLVSRFMEFDFEDILFVGDSGVDAETAINAGMQLVCVEWGYSSKQEMIDAGCKDIVDSALELKKYIEEKI